MSETANALADFLTKMDQKLDAMGEQQKQLDAKLERYSAFMVKKLNDTSEQLVNMQTAQLKLLTESLDQMGSQVSVMERQIGAYLSPDATNEQVMAKLTETSDALQDTMERSINLIGYHGQQIDKRLSESVQAMTAQLEADMQREQTNNDALSQKLSAELSQWFDRFQAGQAVIENPEAEPEQLDAFPENPDGTYENAEIEVFEKPEAPVENPDAVIERGEERK